MRVPQQRNTKTPGHGGGEEHTGTLATAQSTFWSTLLTSCIRLAKERYAVLQCFPVQPSRVVSYDCAVVIQDATTFNSASSATQWLSEWIMGPFAKSLRAELGVQARLWQAETHLQHKKYAHAVWQVLFKYMMRHGGMRSAISPTLTLWRCSRGHTYCNAHVC